MEQTPIQQAVEALLNNRATPPQAAKSLSPQQLKLLADLLHKQRQSITAGKLKTMPERYQAVLAELKRRGLVEPSDVVTEAQLIKRLPYRQQQEIVAREAVALREQNAQQMLAAQAVLRNARGI